MNTAAHLKILITLLSLILTSVVHAQDPIEEAAPDTLDLYALESGWWSYFEQPTDAPDERIGGFVERASQQIAELQVANQATGQSILDAVSDNLEVFFALSPEPDLNTEALPELAPSYTLDEWLDMASDARQASETAAEEQLEVEREQRILDGANRRRDLAFKSYVNAEEGDERLLAALRLIQNRSAQAIAERRLQLLTDRYERAEIVSRDLAERVEVASARLATSEGETSPDALVEQVAAQITTVEERRTALQAAQLEAASIDVDTSAGRSQQQLLQQKLVDAQVAMALAEVQLAKLIARTRWYELQQASVSDTGILQEESLQWSELSRRVTESALEWQNDTENELLASQSVTQDGLDRSSRRLLDQRSGTAQVTLSRIQELDTALADLSMLSLAVDNTLSEYSGAFNSFLTRTGRNFKALWRRVSELGSVRLFEIGDAPVTGGDILRIIIIMIVAFLLSRGIRHAIARFSRVESAGTQASLYTVGRLTHYAIVVIAMLIALSTIGLDFGSLAIVAGALGIGIGFGLQSIVSNFVSGLIILFEHSLRVGDYVELDTGLTGTVKSINVRSTLIRTNDNIDIVVPNSEFVTARLTNWTLGERTLRVRIPFGVAYGSDKELVRQAAIEAAADVQYTLTHMRGRDPDVWLVNFGDSSLDFLLLVWVNRQGASRPTRTRAAYLWALETKLTEYGIEIPFPQRDLNIRSGWPAEKQASLETESTQTE